MYSKGIPFADLVNYCLLIPDMYSTGPHNPPWSHPHLLFHGIPPLALFHLIHLLHTITLCFACHDMRALCESKVDKFNLGTFSNACPQDIPGYLAHEIHRLA